MQVILSSLFNLATVLADNLRFYWTFLTSSPSEVFYANNLASFCLYVSDYWLFLALWSLSSLLSLAIVLADNLKFSWAFLTSSPSCWFYWIRFCIFRLIPSFSASFCSILFLYSVNYWNALDCCALDRRTFSCAFLTSSAKPEFYWNNFWIFFLRASLSWSLVDSLSLYSLSYLMIFWFCWADNLKFSWASLTSSPNPLFSPTNLWIRSWSVWIVTPKEFISWSCLDMLATSIFFF